MQGVLWLEEIIAYPWEGDEREVHGAELEPQTFVVKHFACTRTCVSREQTKRLEGNHASLHRGLGTGREKHGP